MGSAVLSATHCLEKSKPSSVWNPVEEVPPEPRAQRTAVPTGSPEARAGALGSECKRSI